MGLSCSAGCQVETFPCERKTLETVKEFHGNFMCWKGSKGYSTYTSLCPHYRHVYMNTYMYSHGKPHYCNTECKYETSIFNWSVNHKPVQQGMSHVFVC